MRENKDRYTGGTVGLAEEIIDDTCHILFALAIWLNALKLPDVIGYEKLMPAATSLVQEISIEKTVAKANFPFN